MLCRSIYFHFRSILPLNVSDIKLKDETQIKEEARNEVYRELQHVISGLRTIVVPEGRHNLPDNCHITAL